jgi:hypothetical protein
MNPSIYNEYLFIAGQPAKFMVNTVNAGPGALGVTVEGPSKVKLEVSPITCLHIFSSML